MNFPSELDFLEAFGLEPVEEDLSIGMCRYIKYSKTPGVEIDISFSAIMKSFQVSLRLSKQEIATISSENVSSIKIVNDSQGEGLHIIFDICGSISEARVTLDPEITCRWWTICNN